MENIGNSDIEISLLGIEINNKVKFTNGIKTLRNKALRAYMAMKSSYKNMNIEPRLSLKLVDALVKPMSLYASEIWDAFDNKLPPKTNGLLNSKSPS